MSWEETREEELILHLILSILLHCKSWKAAKRQLYVNTNLCHWRQSFSCRPASEHVTFVNQGEHFIYRLVEVVRTAIQSKSCSNSPVQLSTEPVTAVKGARTISNHRWTTSNRSPRVGEVDGAVCGLVSTFEPVLRGQASVTSDLIRKWSEITEVMEDTAKTRHLNPTGQNEIECYRLNDEVQPQTGWSEV